MKTKKPQFELARVFSDGTQENPEIVPLKDLPADMQTDRRGFLGTGIGAAAALLLMDGCATHRKKQMSYKVLDQVTHTWRQYTLPCGSPIPAGAVCTCNCVPAAPIRTTHSYSSCTCNKVCTCVPVYVSDVNAKDDFAEVDAATILDLLAELPIRTWRYRTEDSSIRHIGPMAQDFAAAFKFGDDERHICVSDGQGVAFAAIQALRRIVIEQHRQLMAAQKSIREQNVAQTQLSARIATLEDRLGEPENAWEIGVQALSEKLAPL